MLIGIITWCSLINSAAHPNNNGGSSGGNGGYDPSPYIPGGGGGQSMPSFANSSFGTIVCCLIHPLHAYHHTRHY
jgi:hypothetical protein